MSEDTSKYEKAIEGETVAETCSIIIAKAAAKASGLAAIPIPLSDLFSIAFVQRDMIIKLANEFSVSTEDNHVPLISSGISSFLYKTSSELFLHLTESLKVKNILGETLIKASIAGFLTTILGELFFQHFYKGGTLDNLNGDNISDFLMGQLKSDRFSVETIGKNVLDHTLQRVGLN